MADSYASTGYGPSSSRLNRLCFDGDAQKYELWEEKFLAYMLLKDLKKTILPLADGQTDDTDYAVKTEKAYAELIQLLDDTSLQLVMRGNGKDNGRESLKILRTHYKGKGKTRLLSLYAELGTLMKNPSESITEYVLKGEKIAAAIRNAGETLSDVLMISSILHGLPDEYDAFRVYAIQSEETEYSKFKEKLRNFEETERGRNSDRSQSESVMKASGGYSQSNNKNSCYSCNSPGHRSKDCKAKKNGKLWCGGCKSNTHSDQACRSKQKKGGGGRNEDKNSAKGAKEKEHHFHFKVQDEEVSTDESDEDNEDEECETEKVIKTVSFNFETLNPKPKQQAKDVAKVPPDDDKLLVDTGATAHIVNDEEKFTSEDEKFKPANHFVELADGRKYNNLATRRGDVPIQIFDVNGKAVRSGLSNALCIPSFPQNVFSVSSATEQGCVVTFRKDSSEVVTSEGDVILIKKSGYRDRG